MGVEDLKEYFSTFGEVTDVYIPKPFRSFCFVTFLDPDSTEKLWEEDHVIKGVTVHVSDATPKNQVKNQGGGNFNRGGYDDGYDNYGSQDRGGYSSGGGSGPSYTRRQNYNDRGNNYQSGGGGGGGSSGRKDWSQGGGNNYRQDDAPQQNMGGLPPLPPAIVAAALNQWGLMGGNGTGSIAPENGNGNYGNKGNSGNSYDKGYNSREKYEYGHGKGQSNYDQNDYLPPQSQRNNYGNSFSRR